MQRLYADAFRPPQVQMEEDSESDDKEEQKEEPAEE